MKCCFSPYNFGIILGAIVIICSITFFILESIILGQLSNEEDPEIKTKTKSSAIKSLIICAAAIIISAVFIYAIVKRKHKLIDPWIVFCAGCLIGTFKVMILRIIAIANGTATGNQNTKFILKCVLMIVVEIAIIGFSYFLYRKIRNENRSKMATISDDDETLSSDYTPVPDKC